MAASSSSGPSTHPLIRRPEELGYWNPARLRHFVETAEERWDAVCQILRSDKPGKGTGCLIGGNFLITNHHVIESIEAAKNATACFFQVVSQTARKEKTVVRIIRIALDPDRYFFTCHAKVSGIFKVPQPADEDHLDFTIVALQRDSYLSSIQQKTFSIFKPFAHYEGEEIYIIHHPDRADGETVIADPETALRGDIKVSHGVLKKVYPYYVHYSTSAHRGSSGGAAINVEGQIIALHYQTIRTCREGCTSGFSCYSGIRMDQIVSHLAEKGQTNIIENEIQKDRDSYRNYLSSHLIECYRQKLKTSVFNIRGDGDWMVEFPIEGIYTNLAMIGDVERREKQGEKSSFEDRRIPTHETLYKSKTPIRLEELFNSGRLKDAHKKQAIVFGVAGVGKTTFCEMAAIHGYEWWPQFSTIILIKLRNLNKENYPDQKDDYSLEEVFAKEHGLSMTSSRRTSSSSITIDYEMSLDQFREFVNGSEIRDTLLILDGFDELPSETQNGRGSLKNVIKQLLATFNHVLITSRPMRVSLPGISLEQYCELEIIGFDDKNINLYVDRFYKQLESQGKTLEGTADEKIKKFCLGLKNRPVLHTLVQIPINLTLACSIFNDNEAVFDVPQGLSLTSFYILTVKWLYNRFLLRSVSVHSSSYDLEANPLLDPKIKPIHKALQQMAWTAAAENIIQLQEQMVDSICEENNLSFRDLKDIGLVKFENKSWEFIHLTFQEYFTAVYLAGFYINGKTKKEKKRLLKEGKKHLIKTKFDPRYALTLRMVAGYLSDRGNLKALQTFFDHLFDQPRDFAKHYEFRLFAQCFEECSNPAEISQHPIFIEACVNQIETMPSKNIFDLLNRNVKLFTHDNIVDAILCKIADSNQLLGIIVVLDRIASNRQPLPEKLENALVSLLENANLDDYVIQRTASTLGNIAEAGGNIPESAVGVLVGNVKDVVRLGEYSRSLAVSALGKIAKKGGTISEMALIALVEMIKDTNLSFFIRQSLTSVLCGIAKEEGLMSEVATLASAKIINDTNVSSFVRQDLVSALCGSIKGKKVITEVAMIALVETVKNANLDDFIIFSLAFALGEVVKDKEAMLEVAVAVLIKGLKDRGLDWCFRRNAISILKKIAQKRGTMFEVAMGALADESIREDTAFAREGATSALRKIARNRRTLPKAVARALIELIKVINFDCPARRCAIETLVKGGETMFEVAVGALVEMIKNVSADEHARGSAAEALGKIAKVGGAIPEVAMEELARMVKDLNLNSFARGSAAEALGEIVKGGGAIPEVAVEELARMVKDINLNRFARVRAAWSLRKIAEVGGAISEVVIEELARMVKDVNLNRFARGSAAEALEQIVKGGGVMSEVAMEGLARLVKDVSFRRFTSVRAVKVLGKITQRGGVMSEVAMGILVNVVKYVRLDGDDRARAVKVLGKIAQGGGVMSEVTMRVLVEMVQDADLDSRVRAKTAKALGKIAEEGGVMSEVAVRVLVEMVQSAHLDSFVRVSAVSALGKIAQERGIASEEAMRVLVEMVQNTHLDSFARVNAASALLEITQGEGTMLEVVATDLVEMLKDTKLDNVLGREIVSVLTRIVNYRRIVSEMPVVVLVEVIKDTSLDECLREGVALTLEKIVLGGSDKGEEMILQGIKTALIDVIMDASLDEYLRENAAVALCAIVKGRRVVPEEVMMVFVEMIKSTDLSGYLRENAAIALGRIIKGGGIVVEAAVEGLVGMVKDTNLDWIARMEAASVLGEIANRGGSYSAIAIEVLVTQVTDLENQNEIIFILTEISPSSLIAIITDIDSVKLVLRICALTQKSFSIADGQIYISDNNRRVSRSNPGIDEGLIKAYADELSRMHDSGFLVHSLETSSSLPSQACSSSG